jgi:phosphoribosylformylglycinamidine synthase subunit PurL
VVAEAVLNLACVGARPIAVVNCLNFGNPEHPEVMWQLSEAIDGMAEACRAFDLPVIGGNVSLYNETAAPTSTPPRSWACSAWSTELERRPPGVTMGTGDRLVLLGDDLDGPEPSLAGSAVAWGEGQRGGTLPALDVAAHRAVAALVRDLVADDLPSGVHDASAGGLGVALAELACRSEVGVHVSGVPSAAHLFAEAPGRVIVAVGDDDHATLLERAAAAGVPAADLGVAGGDRFEVVDLVDLPLDEVVSTWRDRLPHALGEGNVQG